MIAIDSDILVYAHREDSSWHEGADRRLVSDAGSGAPWAIPWPCIHEFLAIVTHPRIYDPPTPPGDALEQVLCWLAVPTLVQLAETTGYWQSLHDQLAASRAVGPRVHDAHRGALSSPRRHRAVDGGSGFSRFAGLRFRNPWAPGDEGTAPALREGRTMTRPLNVGMIGYGFMAKAHSNAWRRVANFFPELEHRPVLKSVAARSADKVEAFAYVWDYESVETDWRRLVAREDIDLVDICVPNHLHKEIALAAAAAGKWITCEKPLAMDAAEGEAMVAAVERAGVPNMVWYNYRRVPAITLARQLIDERRIGRPYHYRAQFLQDWTIAPDVPQGGAALWRLDVHAAGSGVTGDLLAHNIDTALWLNGPITKVMAETETFVKERLHQETGEVLPVGIDDACMVMARFANGSLGLFESTRYARGHKALKTLELNGEAGSLFFDLHDDQWLSFFEYRTPAGDKTPSHTAGWRRIHVTNSEHPYMDHWWVPGLTIGYEHTFVHAVADFLKGIATGTPAEPTFKTALQTQKVCDAILRSAKSGQWAETGAE